MKKRLISLFLAVFMCFMPVLTGENVRAALIITKNEAGKHDGYNYELWKDSGTTSMTLKDGGAFSCSWSNIGNVLFRKGKKFDSSKTHEQLGNISIDYGCNYQPDGNSYLCIYGWSVDPLVEYYVVDSWGNWRPPGSTPKGTFTVDGGTYEIYETTRINQPSIQGTKTFQQYWSVRTSQRTSGTISLSEHFKEWEKCGMQLGRMYEVALTVEGYRSRGTADVYSNVIHISGGEASPTPTPTTTSTSKPSPTPNPTASIKTTTPKQVKKLSVKSNKKKTAGLTWQKVSDSKGYQLLYSTDKKFIKNKKSINIKKTKVTIKKLQKGKTYYFKVRAYNLDGNKKIYGKYSKYKKVKIK